MSAALSVPHQLPSPAVEVVTADVIAKRQALIDGALALATIDTPERASEANLLIRSLAEIEKVIEAQVEAKSKPVHQLHKAIIAVGKTALEPITAARTSLVGRVGAWNREQERLRAEALAKAEAERKAAEAAAEAERKRLQAIADAEHVAKVAAAEAERAKLQAEANTKAEAERLAMEAEARELAAILGTPVEEVVVVAPVIAAPVVEAAPVVQVAAVAPVVVVPPPVTDSAVTQRKVQALEITDASLVPAYWGGEQIRVIDRAALTRVLKIAGEIPGARLVDEVKDVMRGVRS